ncbi:hypothetical protein HGRIS_005382 [Hohenbuehelia grisea]|uniref:laccase n=1 Tax=Hohenbuehelia grisea TaxID=104357 RepID=A0ABR3JEV7_9AGAR
MFFPASFVTLALAAYAQAAIGPKATLNVVNKVIQPDGFSRSATLVNGVFPGPLIRGNKGDRFQLNVVDQLNDTTMPLETTIHWHGIVQKGTNWADGAAMVTQCPIVPDHSFLYDFTVPQQAGTFWYHSHFSTQYCDGLRGPFVVYDPKDPHKSRYDVDDESTVLSIGDWYHRPSPQVAGAPDPTSTLFNGLGRTLRDGAPSAPLYVLNVEKGKRYRIRLLNIACEPFYNFTIHGHTMTVIEADGENTQPLEVDMLPIHAGQRYSFVLNANQPVGNYWIRANVSLGDPGFTNGINSAILRYKGAPIAEPTTQDVLPKKYLDETDLHALENPAAPGKPVPGGADVNLHLEFGFDFTQLLFTVNGVAFKPPSVPVLLQILSGAQNPQDLLPQGAIYSLPRGKVVELTMSSLAIAGPHPMHLHGHAFSVVRSVGNKPANYKNPVRRDTVSTGVDPSDNVTIRFTTDNPGPWFLHW